MSAMYTIHFTSTGILNTYKHITRHEDVCTIIPHLKSSRAKYYTGSFLTC